MAVKSKITPDEAQPDAEVLKDTDDGEGMDENALAVSGQRSGSMALGTMGGDVRLENLKFPWLGIAYGVGGLAENFTPGDLVLDKEHLLAHKKQTIDIIVLNTFTYWKEYTAYGSGARPRTFLTKKAAQDAGLTTEWVGNTPAQCKQAMDLRLLIKQPKDLICGLFGVKLEGADWAPARWSVDKQAFDKVNDKLTAVVNFSLKEKGMLYGKWTLTTEVVVKPTKTEISPILKFTGLNTPEVVKQIQDLFAPPAA